MARALRVVVDGGWYHVTARGNRRADLFLNDEDRKRFLGLLSEIPERFGVEVHAFVLMNNHYHLLVRTPRGNLSDAIRWLNVSYSVWFNWTHRQVGHLFQGRFKAFVIEEDAGLSEVARYVHLNPVRVQGLGLGKTERRRAAVTGCEDPGAERVARRLRVLNEWRWSSWRIYAGAEPVPKWMELRTIRGACGGRTASEQRRALRLYTEEPLRQGRWESPWDRLVGGLVLGSEGFARKVLKSGRLNREQQTPARRLERSGRPSIESVIQAAERILGQPWNRLLTAHGDWGRDGVLFVATRYGRFRIQELLKEVPGLRYSAAALAIQRFGRAATSDRERSKFVERLRLEMDQM